MLNGPDNVISFADWRAEHQRASQYDTDEHGELKRRAVAPSLKPSAKKPAKPRAKAWRRHPSYRPEPTTTDVVSLAARRSALAWARGIPAADLLDWLAVAQRDDKLTYAETRKLDLLRAQLAARRGLFPRQLQTLAIITRRAVASYAVPPKPPRSASPSPRDV